MRKQPPPRDTLLVNVRPQKKSSQGLSFQSWRIFHNNGCPLRQAGAPTTHCKSPTVMFPRHIKEEHGEGTEDRLRIKSLENAKIHRVQARGERACVYRECSAGQRCIYRLEVGAVCFLIPSASRQTRGLGADPGLRSLLSLWHLANTQDGNRLRQIRDLPGLQNHSTALHNTIWRTYPSTQTKHRASSARLEEGVAQAPTAAETQKSQGIHRMLQSRETSPTLKIQARVPAFQMWTGEFHPTRVIWRRPPFPKCPITLSYASEHICTWFRCTMVLGLDSLRPPHHTPYQLLSKMGDPPFGDADLDRRSSSQHTDCLSFRIVQLLWGLKIKSKAVRHTAVAQGLIFVSSLQADMLNSLFLEFVFQGSFTDNWIFRTVECWECRGSCRLSRGQNGCPINSRAIWLPPPLLRHRMQTAVCLCYVTKSQ